MVERRRIASEGGAHTENIERASPTKRSISSPESQQHC